MKKFLLFIFLIIVLKPYCQSIQRSSISCFGKSSYNNNILLRQTAGQSSNTNCFFNGQQLRQGFQQPIIFTFQPITESNITINLYPNPTTIETELLISGVFTDFEIVITLISGKELKRIHSEKSINKIDCSDLANGIYLVSIVKNNELYASKKLIIIK
ncbi:MAG: T9SS type A sorting domain-containing protein [Bacteroidota bacterium]